MTPRYFRSPDGFRRWLEKSGATTPELWVGFYNQRSGRTGMTYKQGVDEALCFGWIDGLRKSVDDGRYKVRFTPRKPKSIWSNVNVKRIQELIARGRVTPAGREAFGRRDPARSGVYSFEREAAELGPAFERTFRADRRAWAYFQSRPPWYRRLCAFWVVNAKKDETRSRRLATLIERSAKGLPVGPLDRTPPGARGGSKA